MDRQPLLPIFILALLVTGCSRDQSQPPEAKPEVKQQASVAFDGDAISGDLRRPDDGTFPLTSAPPLPSPPTTSAEPDGLPLETKDAQAQLLPIIPPANENPLRIGVAPRAPAPESVNPLRDARPASRMAAPALEPVFAPAAPASESQRSGGALPPAGGLTEIEHGRAEQLAARSR